MNDMVDVEGTQLIVEIQRCHLNLVTPTDCHIAEKQGAIEPLSTRKDGNKPLY